MTYLTPEDNVKPRSLTLLEAGLVAVVLSACIGSSVPHMIHAFDFMRMLALSGMTLFFFRLFASTPRSENLFNILLVVNAAVYAFFLAALVADHLHG